MALETPRLPCRSAVRAWGFLRSPSGTSPLPAHRSPYAQDDAPLDATAVRAVRPYLAAHEQRRRRREPVLAALGRDMPGACWVHGMEVMA
ncbi:hypothetical protein [Streptomyces sp. NPDC007205]|uniref:hypothetical protein n=1 Tax=Streptomyces sp. NPDC007205 TaxID=3154316 RepID=UPI0033F977FF